MDAKILQNETPGNRLEILKSNAEKAELFTYPKQLNDDELRQAKNEVVNSSIQLAKLKEEKDAFNEVHKQKVKPIKSTLDQNLNITRTRVQEVEETVYLMADQEEGMMGYYNAQGFLIHSRPLLQEEKQFRIVDESKNGTNY